MGAKYLWDMKNENSEEKNAQQDSAIKENNNEKQTPAGENKNDDQNPEVPENGNDIEKELKQDMESELAGVEKIKDELEDVKDKYLRLYSEFENFRRRTAKERMELVKTANEDLVLSLLPVVDDFERAQKALEETNQPKETLEGYQLIYNKLYKSLEQKGLKKIEVEKGSEFDTELHDAISQMPAPEDGLKGKVIDVVEKGYYLGDKVIRFAKVVIGS